MHNIFFWHFIVNLSLLTFTSLYLINLISTVIVITANIFILVTVWLHESQYTLWTATNKGIVITVNVKQGNLTYFVDTND